MDRFIVRHSLALSVAESWAVVGSAFLAASLLLLVASQWLAWAATVRLAVFGAAVLLSGLAVTAALGRSDRPEGSPAAEALLILHCLTIGLLLVVEGQTFVSGAGSEVLFCVWTALALPWLIWVRRPVAAGLVFVLGLTGTLLLGNALWAGHMMATVLCPAAVWSLAWVALGRVICPRTGWADEALRCLVRLSAVMLTAGAGGYALLAEHDTSPEAILLTLAFLPLAFGRTLPSAVTALIGWMALLNAGLSGVLGDAEDVFWPVLLLVNVAGLGLLHTVLRRVLRRTESATDGTGGAWLVAVAKLLFGFPVLAALVIWLGMVFEVDARTAGLVLFALSCVIGILEWRSGGELRPLRGLIGRLMGLAGVVLTVIELDGMALMAGTATALLLLTAILYRSSWIALLALTVYIVFYPNVFPNASLRLVPLTAATMLAFRHENDRVATVARRCFPVFLWALFLAEMPLESTFGERIPDGMLSTGIKGALFGVLAAVLVWVPDADPRRGLRRMLTTVVFGGLVGIWPQAVAPVLGAVAMRQATPSARPLLLLTVLTMAGILYVCRASGWTDAGDLLLRAAWETLAIGAAFWMAAVAASSRSVTMLVTYEPRSSGGPGCPRLAFVWLTVLLMIVGIAHWHDRELLRTGDVVVADLAPVDPRDVLMGDFMALGYKVDEATLPHPGDTHRLSLVTRPDGRCELTASLSGEPIVFPSDSFDRRLAKLPRRWFFAAGEAERWEKATRAVLRCEGGRDGDVRCLLETLE